MKGWQWINSLTLEMLTLFLNKPNFLNGEWQTWEKEEKTEQL